MVGLPEAWAPRGLRLYAIGDVHGCLDALTDIHARIDADLAARPVDDHRIVYLGDYIDRGPDSRGVVEAVLARLSDGHCYCLRGNHEQFLIEALTGGGARTLGVWLGNGGGATLESYGLTSATFGSGLEDFQQRLVQGIPSDHQQFFLGLPHLVRFGDYAFVHAGIRPGRPLEQQEASDLIWIREPFLNDTREHPVVVVHGHTPVDRVEIRFNRIGIDTGAVFGGPLTCLMLEDDRKAVLGSDGPQPLTMPEGAARNDRRRGDVF